MRYLTVILLLLMLGHEASSQEPMGSVYSETEMEDSISSLAITDNLFAGKLINMLSSMVQVDFPKTSDGITEHRILSLDKGSNFCKATVWYDGLKEPADVAAGFPIRPTDTASVVKGEGYIHYADPTVDPERHQFQIYVALLFPDQPVEITTMEGHGMGIIRNYQGGRFHYWFGAAWSEFDVRTQAEWQSRIEGFM